MWKLVKPALNLEGRDGKRIQAKSHMFRNSFAIELLKKGVSLEHVAMLLADSPEIVRDHYYPWVPALQKELERAVQSTWDEDGRSFWPTWARRYKERLDRLRTTDRSDHSPNANLHFVPLYTMQFARRGLQKKNGTDFGGCLQPLELREGRAGGVVPAFDSCNAHKPRILPRSTATLRQRR